MFLDREAMEDLVALGNQGQSAPDHKVGIAARTLTTCAANLMSFKEDRSSLPARQPSDGLKERRLAVSVQADDADAFTGENLEIEIVNDAHRPPAGRQTLHVENYSPRH